MRTLLINKYTKLKKYMKEKRFPVGLCTVGKGASDNVCLLLVNCGLHTEYLNMENVRLHINTLSMGYILVINIDIQILSKILFRFKNDKILKFFFF